eukprot:GFUD01063755.1.p1 GENE.GFUD01063755.1~~GFUD01063755.1.p1  ORF type:complete len:209 (+),score=24.92 GFUD01063755.1:86-712(+)
MKAVNLSVFIGMLVILAYSKKGRGEVPMEQNNPLCPGGKYWAEDDIYSNNKMATLPYMGKTYKVSFDLLPNIHLMGGGYHSVIQFTTGHDCCAYGQRAPAVFTYGSDYFVIASAASAVNGNGNGNYYHSFQIDQQVQEFHIEISQSLYANKYWYNIAINYVSVFTVENTNAQKFDNVEMWAASPPSQYAAEGRWPNLQGIIQNICVIT